MHIFYIFLCSNKPYMRCVCACMSALEFYFMEIFHFFCTQSNNLSCGFWLLFAFDSINTFHFRCFVQWIFRTISTILDDGESISYKMLTKTWSFFPYNFFLFTFLFFVIFTCTNDIFGTTNKMKVVKKLLIYKTEQ
jgi:hypothetical protein